MAEVITLFIFIYNAMQPSLLILHHFYDTRTQQSIICIGEKHSLHHVESDGMYLIQPLKGFDFACKVNLII